MDECNHCGATFDDETAYVEHLRDEHADELGRIERRRVDELESDDGGPDAAMYGAALGVLALGGLLAYLILFSGGAPGSNGPGGAAGADGPSAVGSVHYHGTIDATVGGQQLNFSRQRFQLQADAFHFENGDGEQWHVHAEEVTLAYAMQTLGIDVTNETVTYDGTTYGDDPNETVVVNVNGEPVTPSEYVLQKGDHVRIVANSSD
ncbi:MoaD/ThiS family protein [Halorussus salinisoli]|uniref:MoaD/ThiS family protein n=1 Tax=Halorussus salinisoli TaxID=2558242 RepID=UPI0010C21CD7|nr:MoaD/ThiS family protein [Halorussus salinisoli]